MIESKYINPYLKEDDDDEEENNHKEDKPDPMAGFMMKKLEKLFFEKRAIYLWGVVDDKSAKDLVTKLLLSAGTKGKRYVYPHGEIMIHQPSLGGYFQATSADIEIQANQIRKTKEIGAKILAANCGKTVEQIMKDFDRDYWMDAEEAVSYGIVDAVLAKI
jgi:ATP-dependent Clp protease protease subunit